MSAKTNRPCRCLLKQAGEEELAQTVREYISTLDPDIKADEELYRSRLDKCKGCKNLFSGMCGKCGCYVEMRAAVKQNRCPSEEKLW